ncbi:hypothetical protein K06K5_05990 [Vibrio alginolyticus]|nr:hypothetical protein K06K5_05990 [Vibrio alginolyticus]
MKRRNPHLVFLSRQAMDILIALKTFAGGSDYILPSRYDSDAPMSSATMNRVMDLTYKAAQKEGQSLSKMGALTLPFQSKFRQTKVQYGHHNDRISGKSRKSIPR